MHKTEAEYWAEQRELDELSDDLLLEARISQLSDRRRQIHFEFGHDANRCRCFHIERIA